ncbi:MAG: MBL fold metallo-hydrolase, partial [Lachnospiraceae bacterium]|nr:MBL fold metallo-hydrolase [Lachnospiraceae bacterium]
MMEINMLPVNNGDCIHIRFSDSFGIHNIVVDSGPSTAKRKFRSLLYHIYESGEVIDLLCFSHIDDDHIRAAAQIIPEEKYVDQSFIKTLWLNIGKDVPLRQEPKNYLELSVHNASELYSPLKRANISVITDVVAGMKIPLG